MYQIKLPLTPQSIEQYITHLDIFATYILEFPGVDISFKSQLRNDAVASCRVSVRNGFAYYKDFGEAKSLNCYGYVMEKYNLNFPQALEKIRVDFRLNNIEGRNFVLPSTAIVKSIEKVEDYESKGSVIIQKKAREWLQKDKEYWFDRYGITLEWLKKANIEPIINFWLTNDNYNEKLITPAELTYCYNYYWHDGIFRRKIYQPYSKEFKWLSNVDSTIVQGWDLLPKSGGKTLIVTSSYKDAGVFYCNLDNIHAIAPNTEHTFIPEPVFNKLQQRFDNIYLWYDNDEAGIKNSKEKSIKYNIPYLLSPDVMSKDPSDYRMNHGKEEFVKLVLKNIQDADNN